MKKILFVLAVLFLTSKGYSAPIPLPIVIQPSISVSSVSIAGAQAQILIATPTAQSANSTGYYNYLTSIRIEYYATSTLTGGATPITCVSTNLPGNPVFKFPSAEATGTEAVTDLQFANPLQATQASQITITCPGTASTLWNMTATYFVSN